ncbi:hypothetical protein [Clostridium aminobutyricum]|uniref:Uncharacterized protein n=1 Tax=Clostridium aminobutyricum TaxID=33953 RepID=A0A939IJ68_CLOAM|nr:hypothetical protein [Clostridium aminobutyricum]MBN7773801.1 hypothetical protein [Clostridium aminobutyricum]
MLIDFDNVNLSSYYYKNPDLRVYYLSLAEPIRNRLDESGVEISTLGELKLSVDRIING